jgi:transcriptional regulator with XRE-family HTH domain
VAADGSMARRRQLGGELRRLRTAAGMRIEDAVASLDKSTTWLSRVETGQDLAVVRPPEVRELARIYGVTDQPQVDKLLEILRQSQQPDWWEPYKDVLPSGLETFVGLESDAVAERECAPLIVPGLLQTEAYMRAMYAIDRSRGADAIDRLVAMRLERQRRLTRASDPLNLSVVIDESVLRRPVGGPEVLHGQLDHLIEAARRENVSVQVLPFARGAHQGLHGPFILLHFGDKPTEAVVYVESQAGNLYQEKQRDVRRFTSDFEHLCTAALDMDESVALMTRITKET